MGHDDHHAHARLRVASELRVAFQAAQHLVTGELGLGRSLGRLGNAHFKIEACEECLQIGDIPLGADSFLHVRSGVEVFDVDNDHVARSLGVDLIVLELFQNRPDILWLLRKCMNCLSTTYLDI